MLNKMDYQEALLLTTIMGNLGPTLAELVLYSGMETRTVIRLTWSLLQAEWISPSPSVASHGFPSGVQETSEGKQALEEFRRQHVADAQKLASERQERVTRLLTENHRDLETINEEVRIAGSG